MAEKRKIGRPEGGSSIGNVRLNIGKPISVNPDYVPPKIRVKEPDNEVRKYRCCMCGHEYTTQKGNFLIGGKSLLWKGNNGYLPFCKSCCDILMQSLTSFYSGNEEHALRHLCTIFDWYYCDDASAMTLAQVHAGKSRVTLYPSKMGTRQVATYGTSFLDTIRDENDPMAVVDEVVPVVVEDEGSSADDFVVTKDMVRTWGGGFTPEQYHFLEDEYADWIAKNVCNTKSQEELYRNIALAQLDVRITRQKGGKVSDALDALQKLMSSANILPRQTSENILADTQTFGTLLKKFEETDPIPEPEERWKDVDGIRKYMNTWFRGGLAKALKINNENAELYDEAVEELQKYTVQPPNESSSGQNETSMFDADTAGGKPDATE